MTVTTGHNKIAFFAYHWDTAIAGGMKTKVVMNMMREKNRACFLAA